MNKIFLMIFTIIYLAIFVSAYTENIQGDEDNIIYTASAFEGWNIMNGGLYTLSQITSESDIQKEDIVAIFYYSPSQNEFIRIHPNLEDSKFQEEEDFYGADKSLIMSSAVWVYVKRDGRIQYRTDDMIPMTQRSLTSGWNFVSVTEGALGKNLDEIKGNCQIYNAYYYFKEYKRLKLDMKLPNDMASHGLLIRVIDDCSFGNEEEGGSVISPPSLPLETELPEGETTICEDSDGYDLYTVGKTSYGYGSETTGSKGDYCDFYAKGAESRIGLLREGYCEGNTYKEDLVKCEKGFVCRGGRCVKGDSSLSMCSESDAGKDEFVAGELVGIGGSGQDDCYINGAMTSDCSGSGCSVYEYYCNGETRAWEVIPCSKGCKDGACLK